MHDAARSHSRPPPARAAAVLALALVAGCALPACGAAGRAVATDLGETDAARAAALRLRADAATDTLLARFWDAGAADFAFASPSDGEVAGYWVSANALETLVDAAERTGEARYLDVVRAFVAAQDRRGWTREWFDDEAWMAVALLRAHEATGDGTYLDRAAALVDDVFRSAPDGSCCGDTPGGLWWDRPHSQKATASNAVPVIAAARLFERTGDRRWLAAARGAYAFWRDHMVADDGQVVDHVLPSGERVWWRFSYDGGALLGAALSLHRATGEAAYLDDARRLAVFLVAAQTRPTPAGAVLFDGASCDGDCDAFKGIAHRYLAALAEVADVPGLPALLAADAEAAWSVARDPASGLFGVDWGAPAGSRASLAAQTSAVTALGVEATRAATRAR
jgi:predicted alpha-1,6-mannanase (GH76 family)